MQCVENLLSHIYIYVYPKNLLTSSILDKLMLPSSRNLKNIFNTNI